MKITIDVDERRARTRTYRKYSSKKRTIGTKTGKKWLPREEYLKRKKAQEGGNHEGQA